MALPKRYNPRTREPALQAQWREKHIYRFHPPGEEAASERPIYSIDTPPPTVSGKLHLGHVYSYSHTDFIARFWRMRGYNVFYPMGFDDNGLPTERLVERLEGVRADELGRRAFVERCLAISAEAEEAYRELWQRLGLSIDWRYSYRTIEDDSVRTSQWSFLDLYRRGLAYRREAPAIWCPECQTALAQSDVDDLERTTTFYTLAFRLADGSTLPIATTRPELLAACVAVFIHPDDPRMSELESQTAVVPLFGQEVPILADPGADPEKGTGVVMCCTFGDTADVAWWYTHDLPLVEAIGPDGRMLAPAGPYAGQRTSAAREAMVAAVNEHGLLLDERPAPQSVRVHERCDTPVEFVVSRQWFVELLQQRDALLEAGAAVKWYPAHMETRYRQWVENLAWDWCISRQRAFGVPFPVWYCDDCGELLLAEEDQLPVDPAETPPPQPCPRCDGDSFTPETDVMDTWATSSLTPQIAGRMLTEPELYERVFPFTMRPQAHEIIRTWAFYTIAKSLYHFDAQPWRDAAVSGWAMAPEGMGKLSKSRGGGPATPMEMIESYSADALRYWAAGAGLGKDSLIDIQKIEAGAKLVTKLWNVARFSSRFLEEETRAGLAAGGAPGNFSLGDRWLLSRTTRLVERATLLFERYDYATARAETELYFWDLADNYLEMAKQRLYGGGEAAAGARFALTHALLTILKLFAPILPYVTDAAYQGLLETNNSIHAAAWPKPVAAWRDDDAEAAGALLLEIATAVRRYKSDRGLSLGAELGHLHLTVKDSALVILLRAGIPDLASITRAGEITIGAEAMPDLEELHRVAALTVALAPDGTAVPSQ